MPAGQRYLPGTMVLETTWGTRTGWVIVRDVLLIGPWHHDDERSHTHRRSPTDNDADHVLLRTMRCVNGRVEMHMECEPRVDYGRKGVEWEYAGPGYGKAVGTRRGRATCELTLSTDLRIGFEGGRARARTTLRDGDTAFVALSWSDHGGPETYDDAYHRLVFTADYWHEWLSHGEFPDHPWRTYLQRSALTLKGLTYAPTGAMVAAATTSLPETPGGERNWDYRYAWIRDSTFMLWGLYTLGFDEEANDFFYFIRDVASKTDGELQIMYGIGGEETLTEEMLLHLDGYEHAQPVRVGNGAYAQKQHDVWGALLDSIYLHTQVARRAGRVDVGDPAASRSSTPSPPGASPIAGSGRCAASPSTSPPRRSCAGSPATAARAWRACARTTSAASAGSRRPTTIHADICEHGIDERGVFTQHYDTAALDASCLLIPLVRFLPPDDERVDRDGQRDRRRAHAQRPRAALQGRGDRRRPGRRGGHLRHLLVLAGQRAGRDRRARSRARAVREDARLRVGPEPLRRGDRRALRAPPGQLPAGLHAPGPHQRRHARHPRRPRPRLLPAADRVAPRGGASLSE